MEVTILILMRIINSTCNIVYNTFTDFRVCFKGSHLVTHGGGCFGEEQKKHNSYSCVCHFTHVQ